MRVDADDRVVVHVNAVGAVMGGAARHLAPFLAALVAARPRWRIQVWINDGAAVGDLPEEVGVSFVPRRGYLHRMWWESVLLPRALRRSGADVLLNLTNSAPLWSPVPSVMFQRNPIYWDRTWVRTRPLRFRLESAARRQLAYVQARGSAMVLVPSRAMAEYLRDWPGWPASCPVRVVPHAVDTARFSFRRRPWPPREQPLRLLWVSHAAPHKDQELLPLILQQLRDRGHDASLWLTTGSQEPQAVASAEAVATIVERLELTDHVRFLGPTRAPEQYYDACDVMVFPSRTESFGFPIVEAMASGIPVVATAIASSVEVLGGCGWTFPTGSARGGADAIERLLRVDADAFEAAMTAAAARARTFTWQANASTVADLLDACRE